MKERRLQILAWGSSVVSAALAIWVWGDLYSWKLSNLNHYQWFPLFGLLAFSLMWSHYMTAAGRLYLGLDKSVTRRYFSITSAAVLVFILLHPGLLWWAQWRSGLGLPPGSALKYVAPALKITVISGAIAWLIFLIYELHRWFEKRTWWQYVSYASDFAMLLIFIHGLRLGSHLRSGWFKGVWLFYGVTLVGSLLYIHSKKLTADKA